MDLKKQMQQVKEAALALATVSPETRNKALQRIIEELTQNKNNIFFKNKEDVIKAEKEKLAPPLVKRLTLTEAKFSELIKGLREVVKFEDPLNKVISRIELDKGLILEQVTCPIGVIGVIFEARPEVLVQIAALCLKSGNAVVLKGGSEAAKSNQILYETIVQATIGLLSPGWIQLIETREQVQEILKRDEFIDLIIPRGSNKFVKYIQENTKIPVLGHSEGVCHIYVDEEADLEMTIKIIIDAKCQSPTACNAVETVLVNEKRAGSFLPPLIRELKKNKVEVRLEKAKKYGLPGVKEATPDDFGREFLDLILAVKVVKNMEEAVKHINTYGSGHTDAIITKDEKKAQQFLEKVDSSSVFWNCSTRFSDGYRYGKGAEVGISTLKIHARGPVGMEGLIIYKYLIKGSGQIVADYISGKKNFTHRKLK